MGAGPQTRLFRGVACRSPVLCGPFLCSEIHDLKNLHRVPNLFRCVCVCQMHTCLILLMAWSCARLKCQGCCADGELLANEQLSLFASTIPRSNSSFSSTTTMPRPTVFWVQLLVFKVLCVFNTSKLYLTDTKQPCVFKHISGQSKIIKLSLIDQISK